MMNTGIGDYLVDKGIVWLMKDLIKKYVKGYKFIIFEKMMPGKKYRFINSNFEHFAKEWAVTFWFVWDK